jgi:glycosyltransferase involved in cell wall biosynthesis
VAAERGLRRILAHQRSTVLHLRMADVGSLAAARLARRQGLPIVFTLAPDPHAVIAEMERSGELDRATFGAADAAGALWFRVRVVRHLADAARRVVLFPRAELGSRLRELLDIDVTADPGRYHVIPEGIDPAAARAARAEVARAGITGSEVVPAVGGVHDAQTPLLADLQDALAALGPNRSGLPLVVSVGRLAELKGMARIVDAFAIDAPLRERANLVIVGGDLTEPSPEERAEMDRIEGLLVLHPEVRQTMVMLGHRPHHEVLRLLAVAEAGLGTSVAPGGAYVCGSRKEEFGLAIVEALAIGLPVVAPRSGGPASYVDDGVTGRLVDTLDRSALVEGIHAALDLTAQPGRAERARDLVARRFTTGAMSDALVPVYVAALRADRAEAAGTAALPGGATVRLPEEGVAA